MKDSAITITDQFCGAGGSSIGAEKVLRQRGGRVAVALNHWKLAIETHNHNFPDTIHDCTDISACDPRRYPKTTGLITSPECFVENTLIVTKKGLVPIQDIKRGDFVLTHKKRFKRVLSTMVTEKETIIISGQGHRALETTNEHPFYVIEQGRIWNNTKRQYDRTFSNPLWKIGKDLGNKTRWASVNQFPKMEIPKIEGNNNRSISFTNEFWWIVGRWLGDGCLRIRKNHSNELTIVCGKHEVDFLEKKLNYTKIKLTHASKDEIKFRKREIRTAFLFEATHDSLCTWLVDNFGKKAHGKKMPSWVYSMQEDWRKSLLDGYISADGHITKRDTHISSVSKKLALGIKILANSLGFHCSFGSYTHKESIIEGRKLNKYNTWIVKWENNKSQRTGIIKDGYCWNLIKSVNATNEKKTVYNLSVEEDESYIADGIVVHNCTNHSLAKGKKAVSSQLSLFEKGILDPACERSRATMWDVPRFAEYHKYEFIIVENVVDARKWVQFPAWIHAMDLLGYNFKPVYANSMHFEPTPQSRDRMYVVFWKKGNRAPDLELRPKAYCNCCEKNVEAVQAWKNPLKKFGKYKQQYIYVCPDCVNKVEPYYHAAFNIIDWSNVGTRIGDRKKPLSPNTEKRIKHGLEKYGKETFIFHRAYGDQARGVVKSMFDAAFTQTTLESQAICTPFIIKGEHTLQDGYVKKITEAVQTQTVRQSMAVVLPFIINNQQQTGIGFRVKSSTGVVQTQSTQASFSLAIPSPFIVVNKGQSKTKSITEPTSTQTTKPSVGLVTPEAWGSFISNFYGNGATNNHITGAVSTVRTKESQLLVNYQEPRYEDCFYRMLMPHEIQAAMAFGQDYVVLGSGKDKVKQLGNAVTPPVMEWLVDRCVQSLEK